MTEWNWWDMLAAALFFGFAGYMLIRLLWGASGHDR